MDEKMAEFLKQLRLEKNLSQNQLADEMHVSRSVIAKYEVGIREITLPNLLMYSEYFDITVTELLACKRMDKPDEKVNNAVVSILNKHQKILRLVKLLRLLILMILVFFVSCITVLNYTATKVYKVATESNINTIYNGLLVKTKDRMYITFVNGYDKSQYKHINLYYVENHHRNYILKNCTNDKIYINERINGNEYFRRQDIKHILKDLYIELVDVNDNEEIIKVEVVFEYSNKKLDKKNDKILEDTSSSIINKSEIFDVASDFINNNNDKTFKIKYNKTNYEMMILNDKITVKYNVNNENYLIEYKIKNNIEHIKLQVYDEPIKNLYFYNISEDKCDTGDCSKYIDDIKLISKLINKAK